MASDLVPALVSELASEVASGHVSGDLGVSVAPGRGVADVVKVRDGGVWCVCDKYKIKSARSFRTHVASAHRRVYKGLPKTLDAWALGVEEAVARSALRNDAVWSALAAARERVTKEEKAAAVVEADDPAVLLLHQGWDGPVTSTEVDELKEAKAFLTRTAGGQGACPGP